MSDNPGERPLFIVSDSTGDTATRVTRAALRQFEEHAKVPVQVFPNVSDKATLERILKAAALQGAFVVTSLVSAEQRAFAHELAKAYRILQVDVIGSLLTGLSGWLGEEPQSLPGLLHKTDAEYFKRIEAVEFTVKLDDGKDPRMLTQADIVLVGVSRTSKTPLSVFLAYKGYKVANVPIVLDHDPPRELWNVEPRRVFALTIDPESLQHIRRQRLRTMRLREGSSYGDLGYILAELEYAEQIFRRNRQWPVINVTRRAVEETAQIIISHLTGEGVISDRREVGQL
ncbi:MAG: kinase/pyrophosphorylase [Deltaproteobacteria bacterium]|nr:kinase/pyrophosphorylase [Deltaproteobacteria bacterium]